MPRRTVHHLRLHLAQALHQAGMDALHGVGNRGEHQLAHHIRMAKDELQGDCGARAVAEDVGGFDSQLTDCGSHVIRHPFEAQRAVDVRCASVTLKLEGDDLPGLGEAGQELSERGADRGERAVQQHQRLSRCHGSRSTSGGRSPAHSRS